MNGANFPPGPRVAAYLRHLRLKAGLRIRDVSERSGAARQTVSQWELGDRQLTVPQAARFLSAVGATDAESLHVLQLANEDACAPLPDGEREALRQRTSMVKRKKTTKTPAA